MWDVGFAICDGGNQISDCQLPIREGWLGNLGILDCRFWILGFGSEIRDAECRLSR